MSNGLSKIKKLYDDRCWIEIANIYYNRSYRVRVEEDKNEQAVDIYLKALRNVNDFDAANLLEKKSTFTLSSKVSLYDIFRLVFCKHSYGGFEARPLLSYAVHKLNKVNESAWLDFIELLVSHSSIEDFSIFEDEYFYNRKDFFIHKKIFISGFGRSGTGALRSFLNEFNEVYQVPGSEIQVINGSRGLWSLYLSDSKEDFRNRFLEFFVVHALGVSIVNNSQDEKELDRAKQIISNSNDLGFLQAFYFLYVDVFFSQEFSKELVERACQSFLERYISSLNRPEHKSVFLFNNVVNAENIRKMRLVDNYICFAVTRDPRSQYASFLSTQKPDWNVRGFLDHFRRFDEFFQKGLHSLGDRAEKIKLVRFEDVVYYEDFRQSLVKLCSLDNENARRFSMLKPEESMENMFLHNKDEFFDREDDFERILKELPEHCISSQYN